jgi:hypothetical protein
MFSVCSVKFHYFSFGSVYFQCDMAGVFLFSLFDCTCSYLNEINTRSSTGVVSSKEGCDEDIKNSLGKAKGQT